MNRGGTSAQSNQLKTIQSSTRLQYDDLKRIAKYIDASIFDTTKCSIWTGYITNAKSDNKGTYINFYFRKKGDYTFTIEQIMREDPLNNVLNVGIRIEK